MEEHLAMFRCSQIDINPHVLEWMVELMFYLTNKELWVNFHTETFILFATFILQILFQSKLHVTKREVDALVPPT